MWYKRLYENSSIEVQDYLDMYDRFQSFYSEELRISPKDAKGLAMFEKGRGYHYFHTFCHYHLEFFIKHGCSDCEKPSHAINFLLGDEEFGSSIVESFSKK
jgi:hypothetical protein